MPTTIGVAALVSVVPFLLFPSTCPFVAAGLGMTLGILAAILCFTGFSIYRFHIRLCLGIGCALTMLRL